MKMKAMSRKANDNENENDQWKANNNENMKKEEGNEILMAKA